MPGVAERRPLRVGVDAAGGEDVAGRGGEVHVVVVAARPAVDRDGQIRGRAADRDAPVAGVELPLRAAADPVAGIAVHDDVGDGAGRRARRSPAQHQRAHNGQQRDACEADPRHVAGKVPAVAAGSNSGDGSGKGGC